MANQLRYSKGEKFGIIAAKVTRKHGKYYDRRRGLYGEARSHVVLVSWIMAQLGNNNTSLPCATS